MTDADTLTGSLSYGMDEFTTFVEDDDPEAVLALELDEDDEDWDS